MSPTTMTGKATAAKKGCSYIMLDMQVLKMLAYMQVCHIDRDAQGRQGMDQTYLLLITPE